MSITCSHRSLYRKAFGKRAADVAARHTAAREALMAFRSAHNVVDGTIMSLSKHATQRLLALVELAEADGHDTMVVTADDMVNLLSIEQQAIRFEEELAAHIMARKA